MNHLVTGAGSGIGAALVAALHERGDALVLMARSKERAGDLEATYPGATTLVADLADPTGLERALAAGDLPDSLDSVIHVAGAVDLAPVAEFDLADWQRQLDVNLTAPALVTRAALPALRVARGLVLSVNSGAGLSAHPDWSAYAASKFGLRAFADALRGEEKPNGVRVTTVFPGRTATPMQEKVHDQEGRGYDASAWIHPGTVAATILHVLDLPRDATIPEVSVHPTPR
jgi:short-subunit dehydrogenase